MLTRLSLMLVAGLLLAAAPARAATFNITGFTENGSGCDAGPEVYTCGTLRSAVETSNELSTANEIVLPAGQYDVSTQLTVASNVTIRGAGARTTTIRGAGTDRVLQFNGGVTARVERLTIRNGFVAGDFGGNIKSLGLQLTLSRVRVLDGRADQGGGIANLSSRMVIEHSLIENNTATLFSGGGILNSALFPTDPTPGTLTVVHSTFAGNTASSAGGALATEFLSTASLAYVTIAHSHGAGRAVTGTTAIAASVLAANDAGACSSSGLTDGGANVEDGTTCAFTQPSSVRGVDPQLGGALADLGGDTDLYPIAETSPARDRVANCAGETDQRGVVRGSPCDAGAHEFTAGAPVPQTPPPSSTPTQSPSPPPSPAEGRSVVGRVVSGTVLVRLPGARGFTPLDPSQPIPLGSIVDTRKGKVEITALLRGKLIKARFFEGLFRITATARTIDLTLTEALAKCPKRASAAAKKPKSRRLWGEGSGSFRTRGQYSAATVRGTEWLVQDSCAGTLTRVKAGAVNVVAGRRTIILRAGKSYLAKPRR